MYSCIKQVLLNERLRHFSLRAAINKSHYDSLGVTPKATQHEIKNAYYKLSMLYHPDKNEGSDEAANKFRDITTAYEVLGNLKLRKLYDKGLLHTSSTEFSAHKTETVPENKFYKSREHRSRPPATTGKSEVYNFDEWTRAHYEHTFEKTKQHRYEQEVKLKMKSFSTHAFQSEMAVYSMIALTVVCLAFFTTKEDLDTPAAPKKKINPDNSIH